MSTSPQTGAQRVIYVQLDHEPEVTHEVRLLRILVMSPFISATVCGRWLSGSCPCLHARHLKAGSYHFHPA